MPFPGDGVSGFGKPDTIEVCIGTARLLPSAGAALCAPSGTAPKLCESNDACPLPERCQCGRCLVTPCDGGSVCPTGEACRGGRCTLACTENSECAAEEVCDGGGCTRPCTSDGNCHRGEVCDLFGTCRASACGDLAACGPGYSCETVVESGEVREPSVVRVGGERIVFFEVRRSSGVAVYRGRFSALNRLLADPPTAVLTAPTGMSKVGAPSALVRGDRIDLFVEVDDGTSLGWGVSKDNGRSFEWTSSSALTPTEEWESSAVRSPSVFEYEGATFVFYAAGDSRGVGLAKLGADSLARVSKAPLLRPSDLEDAVFWRSVQAIDAPFAMVTDGALRVYVTARGVEGGTDTTPNGPTSLAPNDSIGLFATTDLKVFERSATGPVYTTISGLFGAQGEREPSLDISEEGAALYFVATDFKGAISTGLSVARSPR